MRAAGVSSPLESSQIARASKGMKIIVPTWTMIILVPSPSRDAYI